MNTTAPALACAAPEQRGRRPRGACQQRGSGRRRSVPRQERIHFVFGLLLRIAVALLKDAHETLGAPFDAIDVVVGELSPLLFDRTLQLKPLALEDIGVHWSLPTDSPRKRQPRPRVSDVLSRTRTNRAQVA